MLPGIFSTKFNDMSTLKNRPIVLRDEQNFSLALRPVPALQLCSFCRFFKC